MPPLPDGVISSQLPDRSVVGLQAAFIEQLFDIAERERIPKIPAHRANNQFRSRLSPLEDCRSGCFSHALFRLPTAGRHSCNTSNFGDDRYIISRTMSTPVPSRKRFYTSPAVQVLFAITVAIILGYLSPAKAVAMRPLGDAFIRLITMVIALVVFCTVVTGIAEMRDLKKVRRVGGKALLYFEAVSTLALVIGLAVGNLVQPGSGFHVNPATLDAKAVASYAGQAKAQTVTDFLLNIIPSTFTDAFAKGNILQVLLVALLFGMDLSL